MVLSVPGRFFPDLFLESWKVDDTEEGLRRSELDGKVTDPPRSGCPHPPFYPYLFFLYSNSSGCVLRLTPGGLHRQGLRFSGLRVGGGTVVEVSVSCKRYIGLKTPRAPSKNFLKL